MVAEKAVTQRPGFLAGGGETAELIAGFDWGFTSLGPMDGWPQSARSALGLMLRAPVPIVTLWGEQGVMIYNDAYAVFSGNRHPGLLGMNVREAWEEVADWNDNVMRIGLAGGTLSCRDQMLELNRNGVMERVWLNLDYSPITDEAGVPIAVMAVVLETTAKVRAEMQLKDDQARLQQMFAQAPGLMAIMEGADHVFTFANGAYAALVGERPLLGLPVRQALPEVVEQGFVSLLDQVRSTGQPVTGRGVPVTLVRQGVAEERFVDFVYQPIVVGSGTTGIFVQGHDVTDLKRTEIALRESEARFRLVAESAPVMLWMSDAEGRGLYFNAAQRAFWALAPEEVPAFDWQATVHPEDAEMLTGPYGAAMRDHTGFSVEARLRRADGSWRRILTVGQPRLGPEDVFLGMIGVNVDLTAMRETEVAIRDESRRLATLNRTGAAIAAELDLDRIVQLVCDACVVLIEAEFGAFFYNVADAQGERYTLHVLSGAARAAFDGFPMPRATAVFRPTFRGERVIRSDDIQADPRYGRSGPYHGMPAGHLPVRSYLAVPVVSRSGEVIGGLFFGHPEPGRFTARHEDIVAGIAGQAAVAMDNARLFEAAERELAERRRAEAALQRLNETLEQRVAEEVVERSKAEAALRQSQKLETIGKLTGGVAHDFNNLLQVISGNLQLLGRDLRGDAGAQKRIADALAGVDKGAKLASQLLAFSRRQPLEPKVVNVGRLVAGMGEMLRRTIGEGISVEVTEAADLWNCLVDPTQLEAAILNLALNARDAMGEGGRLTIAAANARLDDLDPEEAAEVRTGDYVALSVRDSGAGIAPEILDQVFEPFFSTKPPGKGTGLGLSMVYGFVRQSGGHVRLVSQMGHGTTVRLYLPRIDAREDVPVAGETGPAVGGRETVLVAEDDDDVRATVVALLGDLGYRVLTARDAAAALEVIDSGVPIDLLFTDVVMPGRLRSPQLARLARERRPGIAVLFTSGYTEDAITRDGRLDAGVELISKPYTREALARKIRAMLGPAAAAPEAVAVVAGAGLAAAGAAGANGVPGEPRVTVPVPDGAAAALTVLVVEDEPLILMNTADTLRDFGMTVLEAGSGSDALGALAGGGVPDVLVVDVGLPDGSGVDLARSIRQRLPGLPIIFATGRVEVPGAGDMERVMTLVKPYGESELVEGVRRMAALGREG